VLCSVPTGASGGYLENVFRYAAKELFNVDMTERMCLVTLVTESAVCLCVILCLFHVGQHCTIPSARTLTSRRWCCRLATARHTPSLISVIANVYLLAPQVDGQPALRFAAAYGFRNIQNVMRLIKRKNCPYHYVEIMACPSGEVQSLCVCVCVCVCVC